MNTGRRLRRTIQVTTGYICERSSAILPEGEEHALLGCEMVYSLPSSPRESRAAAEQRKDRHRRREELKLRQLERSVVEMLDVKMGDCNALLSHVEKQRNYAQNAHDSKRVLKKC